MNASSNPVRDLYRGVYREWLPQAAQFSRATGYFSVTALSVGANAYADFFARGGHMLLLTGEVTSHDAMGDAGDRSVELSESDFLYYPASCFRELLKRERLVVKVATRRDANGTGIFHTKYGVLELRDGGKVSFLGSANETGPGIGGDNYEETSVYAHDDARARERLEEFQRLWTDQDEEWSVSAYQSPERSEIDATALPENPDEGVLRNPGQLENWRLDNRLTRSELESIASPNRR